MKRKTERVIFLAEPRFKRFLQAEARREGVSVAELVRSRFEPQRGEEQAMLAELAAEVGRRADAAAASVDRALRNIDTVLAELRLHREERAAARAQRAGAAAPSSEGARSGKSKRAVPAARA